MKSATAFTHPDMQDNVSIEAFDQHFSSLKEASAWDMTSNSLDKSFRCVFTPGIFARENLLCLESIVLNLNTHPGFYLKRKDYHSYQIQFTTCGEGQLIYEDEVYDLHPGDCYFIDCKKEHYFRTVGANDWIHHGIQLNGTILEAFFNQYFPKGSVKVLLGNIENITKLFTQIASACYSKLATSEIVANQLLWDLITKIAIADQRTIGKELTPRFSAICEYINTNYDSISSLDDIAEASFISKYYLCREFKQQTGHTVNDYLTLTRINAAKNLLLNTSVPVSEIALLIGFNSANYFFSVFKYFEGVTPAKYRDNH